MRVLVIVTAYDRSETDVITPWLSETIRKLGARGVTAEVLAPSYRGLPSHGVGGVRVHRFRYAPRRWEDLTHDETTPDRILSKPLYASLLPGYLAAGTAAARRLLRTGGFDLVHAHWPLPHALMALAARGRRPIPLVSSFHGVELTLAGKRLPFLRPMLRYVIEKSDVVTANSRYTADLVRSVHDRPVVRIPFGASLDFPPARDPGPADDRNERAGERPGGAAPRLLFVGRLVERKGVRHLLEAMARLEDLGARLDVIGDGPLRRSLEARARSLGLARRVRFRGFVDGDELVAAYADADVFVLPAVHDAKGDVEGLGVVLIEALTAGVPVIASDAGGIPDIVIHERTGLLVPPGDGEALARAVRRIVADPALGRSLTAGGRRHVEEEFSWDAVIDRLEAVYRDAVRTEKPGPRAESADDARSRARG